MPGSRTKSARQKIKMNEKNPPVSHLFTLRLWPEVDEEGNTRWRGKLRHIPSDTVHHFRGWASLVPLLLSILRQQAVADDGVEPEPEET